mgnify:CR=1 FL=1
MAEIPSISNPLDINILDTKNKMSEALKEAQKRYHLKNKELKNNKELIKELKYLTNKVLGCYCCSSNGKGKLCHGHNIIKLYKKEILGI